MLLFSWPFILLFGTISRIKFGRFFFIQKRPGKGEKIFNILKITSLPPNHNPKEQLSGYSFWIRKSGLDELPQLINILRGEMSFVGPRPLLPEYLIFYTDRERSRHNVQPGIFGLSQLEQMKRFVSWKERLELDAIYAEKSGFFMDLRIIVLSLGELLIKRSKNANDFERYEG